MNSLAGTVWKLVAVRAYDDAGRELPPPYGSQPLGIVSFDAERIIGAIGGDQGFSAYTGRYQFDGSTLVTKVDGASSPELLADQVRHVRFESLARMVAAPQNPILGRGVSLEVTWEKVG